MQELLEAGPTGPRLIGQRCAACSALTFPPNPHGCEACGAPASKLLAHKLDGRGRVLAFAVTHLAPRKDVAAPYTIAAIELEAGLVIRALITESKPGALAIGDKVRARISESAVGTPELQFEPGDQS